MGLGGFLRKVKYHINWETKADGINYLDRLLHVFDGNIEILKPFFQVLILFYFSSRALLLSKGLGIFHEACQFISVMSEFQASARSCSNLLRRKFLHFLHKL